MILSESQQNQAEHCIRELHELCEEHPGEEKYTLALHLFHEAYASLILKKPHGSLEGKILEGGGERWKIIESRRASIETLAGAVSFESAHGRTLPNTTNKAGSAPSRKKKIA